MKQLDNDLHSHDLEPSQNLNQTIEHNMEDHDLLLHHVTQHDHELYALDCALCDLLGS